MRVIGYKWLCVETPPEGTRTIALLSAFDAYEWTRGTNLASYAPAEENLWGFNAYYSATRARWLGRRFGMVVVGVTGFGTVALYHRGWRAERAEIVAVYLPRRLRRLIGKDRLGWFSERLSVTYDVPVYRSIRRLRHETERWGHTGAHFLKGGSDVPA